MTTRIHEFLRNRRDDGPCLVVDLDVVRDNYQTFAKALPGQPRVLRREGEPGAGECCVCWPRSAPASTPPRSPRSRWCSRPARTPDRISFGNTIKKERDIARAYELGVRLFAVDCKAEVEKVARAAPGAKVFCRILFDCVGAEWPLSRKFGCEPEMAVDVLEHAHRAGLDAYGVSFHVGSQQRNARRPGTRRSTSASTIFRACARARHQPVDGQPRRRLPDQVPEGTCRRCRAYGRAIFRALRKHFGNRIPETIIEPGRGMVGNAGVIEAEVVLVSKKSERRRGALGLSRHRQVRRSRRDDGRVDPLPDPHAARRRRRGALRPGRPDLRFGRRAVREEAVRRCPVSLEIGDKVLIEGTGAYTTTYSAVAFNGFAPLKTYHI